MGIFIEQTKPIVLPVGEYLAQVAEVEEVEGQFGPQIKFKFDVLNQDEPTTLTGWCGRSFNIKSKLYQWDKAMFGGADIPEDYNFDSDDVLRRKVLLTIIKRTGKDGSEFNKIDAVLPVKKKAAVPGKPPVKPPLEEEETE